MKNYTHEKRRYPLDVSAVTGLMQCRRKGILENLFDDFLRFFFPDADKLFDMDKGFQFLDKELEQLFPAPENMQAPKFVDKLVKVFTKAGKEEWLLIHIEIQGYNDKDFAKRMFHYWYYV